MVHVYQTRSAGLRHLGGRCRKAMLGVWVRTPLAADMRLSAGFQARSKDQEILEEGGGAGFQARSKDQEILEEGGGAGPSSLPRSDHE